MIPFATVSVPSLTIATRPISICAASVELRGTWNVIRFGRVRYSVTLMFVAWVSVAASVPSIPRFVL